jgi:hypothetical protein
VLHYNKAGKAFQEKHSSFLGPIIGHKENVVFVVSKAIFTTLNFLCNL